VTPLPGGQGVARDETGELVMIGAQFDSLLHSFYRTCVSIVFKIVWKCIIIKYAGAYICRNAHKSEQLSEGGGAGGSKLMRMDQRVPHSPMLLQHTQNKRGAGETQELADALDTWNRLILEFGSTK